MRYCQAQGRHSRTRAGLSGFDEDRCHSLQGSICHAVIPVNYVTFAGPSYKQCNC